MWYKTVEDKRGNYTGEDGKLYILVQCNRALNPQGRKNAELGLTEFNTLEECLTLWKLTKVERKPETYTRDGRTAK